MNKVTITREDFDKLLYLAEEALDLRYSEFSNDPTDEDRELMLKMWALIGKDVPGFFCRNFGWTFKDLRVSSRS